MKRVTDKYTHPLLNGTNAPDLKLKPLNDSNCLDQSYLHHLSPNAYHRLPLVCPICGEPMLVGDQIVLGDRVHARHILSHYKIEWQRPDLSLMRREEIKRPRWWQKVYQIIIARRRGGR